MHILVFIAKRFLMFAVDILKLGAKRGVEPPTVYGIAHHFLLIRTGPASCLALNCLEEYCRVLTDHQPRNTHGSLHIFVCTVFI